MRSLLTRLGPFGKGLLGAIVGVILVLLVVHAWVDHILLHQLGDYITQQVAPKIQKLP